MNILRIFTLPILFLLPIFSYSQQFWLLTNEFWGGPKTCITLIDDTVLLAGTTTGILKSTDNGYSLEQVLSASAVQTLFATSQGTLLAGGKGKIFFSEDLGTSWDSVALNSVYPVKQIIQNKNETLLAITGDYNNGDGVFYSEDNGRTWNPRNNGLGTLKGCEKVAADKNGRLYLSISDEGSTGNGGLFISEDNGLLWEKVTITLDSIIGPVKVTHTTGLSISSDDSLYLSFYGVATNYMVQLNISKSIQDVPQGNSWSAFHVNKSAKWWEDNPLNNIHFSQNGDRYSSYTETVNHGATCYSKAGDQNWHTIDYGLGSAEDGWRYEQFFAEKKSGRIFMVQYLDERIYTTDNSLLTDVNVPVKYSEPIFLFPNPVKANGKLKVQISPPVDSAEIAIYDLTGRKVSTNSKNTFEITCPQKAGIYIIAVKHRETLITEKITVK